VRRHGNTGRRSDVGMGAANGAELPGKSTSLRHIRGMSHQLTRSRLFGFVTSTLVALSLVSVVGIQPAAADSPCVAVAKTPYDPPGGLIRFSGYASCPQVMQQLIIRVKGWWKRAGSTTYHNIANNALNCGSGEVRCPSSGDFNVYGTQQSGCKIYWTQAIATFYYYGIPVAYQDKSNSNNREICH
jgi:hypothetical protein